VSVENNGGGGILLDGAAFEITDSKVTGNGPGSAGAITWGGLLVQSSPATGPAKLDHLTVSGNNGPGVSCASAIEGTAVSASGNAAADIGPTCGITSCGAPSATCGAM
jgi:hypothetical protein